MWIEDLSDDVILRIISFYRFAARDVILQAKPNARVLYRAMLERKYPLSATRSMQSLLSLMTMGGVPQTEDLNGIDYAPYPTMSLGDSLKPFEGLKRFLQPPFTHTKGHGKNNVQVQGHSCIFTGAIVFGSNIRYIETKIGQYTIPGSRIYYKTRGQGVNEIAQYEFPSDFQKKNEIPIKGIPICAVFQYAYLHCNTNGRIHSMISLCNFINDPISRYHVATASWVCKHHGGGSYLCIQDGLPFMCVKIE